MRKYRFILVVFISVFYTYLAYSQNSSEIFFISDTQAPLWIEKVFQKSNNNQQATKQLFYDIEKNKPKALFILGDITGMSSYSKLWEPIDEELNKLKNLKIPYYALPGNHEYMFTAGYGMEKFNKRFPGSSGTYFKVYDSVAIIMLNSNFSKMKKEEKMNNYNLYVKLCDSLDAAPGIKKIIIACHHSPYTNSKTVKPSEETASMYGNKYLELKKSALFISGHSHNIELFKQKSNFGDKFFLVAGGGGGLTQSRHLGKDIKYIDYIDKLGYRPQFFYISALRSGNELIVNIHGLSEDFSKINVKRIDYIK